MQTCPVCEVSFQPLDRGRRQLCCSADCRRARISTRSKERRRARLVERACGECGDIFLPLDGNTRYCSTSCRKRHGNNLGRALGKPWIVKTYTGWTPARQAAYQRRRALIKGATAPGELIVPADIYERDGWVCGLCGDDVDRDLNYPDPMSASLDHVVPVSLGGPHAMSNVQCSHLFCNLSKNNRVAA